MRQFGSVEVPQEAFTAAVSYTHLDVYKRQRQDTASLCHNGGSCFTDRIPGGRFHSPGLRYAGNSDMYNRRTPDTEKDVERRLKVGSAARQCILYPAHDTVTF